MSEEKSGFDWKGLLSKVPWLSIVGGVYKGLRPKLAEKVASSEAKWDDWVFEVLDGLAVKLLHVDLGAEKSREDLVKEVAPAPVVA